MGATFSRVKDWIAETLTDADLDAEFNNILTNMTPTGIDDHSASLSQMKTQTTPGAQGTESLATSLGGEIERLRYVLNRLIGGTYWYDAPPVSLTEANTLISLGNALPGNRIVSGRVRSASDAFPIFLQPHGTNATVTLKGASTPFVFYVNGTIYTISSDVTATGLSPAPSSNNTCLVNDASLAGATATKYVGELDSGTLTVDTMGTEISSLVGKYAAFKTSTEYFTAFVKSTTELTNCRRGNFFDSADAPLVRVAISNNDTITLCKLTWVFATTAGTITTTQTNPIWAYDQPSSPANGDYWFDLDNNTWKTFNGSSFVSAAATLIGTCVLDTSGCKAARSGEVFAVYTATNSVRLEKIDNGTIRSVDRVNVVNVAGSTYRWEHDFITWDTTNDLVSGVTDSASIIFYAYITENGDTILDSERPYDRRGDLLGHYHPYHNWRSLGTVSNNGSSDFGTPTHHDYNAYQVLAADSKGKLTGIDPGATRKVMQSNGTSWASTYDPIGFFGTTTAETLTTTSPVKIAFSEITDTGAAWNTDTYTVPAGQAGLYLVTATVTVYSNTGAGNLFMSVYHGEVEKTRAYTTEVGNGYAWVISLTYFAQLDVGNTISIRFWGTSANQYQLNAPTTGAISALSIVRMGN